MNEQDSNTEVVEVRGGYDLTALRRKLDGSGGRRYWRSLEELADDEEFLRYLNAEFPEPASMIDDGVSRRQFLKIMGASFALAGLSACTRQPTEKIYPYVKPPEEIVPGKPLYFASAFELSGQTLGVLVESHIGRPTKIEGNPDHPAANGATDVFAQASVLDLYDPDRSQVVTENGNIRPYSAFVAAVAALRKRLDANKGRGLHILTRTVVSPTLRAQLKALLADYPEAKRHEYEPVNADASDEATRLLFGRALRPQYDLGEADVIVSLDADLLGAGPANIAGIRAFAARRRPTKSKPEMNRLYVVEPTPSLTGGKADHRLPVSAGDVETAAFYLASRIGLPGPKVTVGAAHKAWLDAVADDLKAHRGAALVVPGAYQPASVHLLAHAINEKLGATGSTVRYREPVGGAKRTSQMMSIKALASELHAGNVDTLVVIDANPVYDAPADLDFAGGLEKVAQSIHVGLHVDETAWRCGWHVAGVHALETWSDVRAQDGTLTVMQPLIDPLYDGRSAHEIVALLAGKGERSSYDLVREQWKARLGEDGFEAAWQRVVHDGLASKTPGGFVRPKLQSAWAATLRAPAKREHAARALELIIRPDAHLWDGRFANNGWLQELPRPVTKLVWDNAVLVSPHTADELRLNSGDIVKLSIDGRSVEAPVWIQPGQSDGVATVHLGYGRRRAGRVGTDVGFDAYALRTSSHPWQAGRATIEKTGATTELATTQHHHSMEGRHTVRSGTLEEYRGDAAFARKYDHLDPEGKSMFPDHPYEGYAWGMTIDLSACVGCNACTIACQAENNIPVVGKEQVQAGRAMHWIRVDRYFSGDFDNPSMDHQPVPCMHCERAPCEVVCPVNATVHSDEGLNDMVYNRCVGTRYCSNNCPYKVRRFNFFLYTDWDTETLKLQRNPDVTVRSRGVMEKCTYCVQRISSARIEAKKEFRKITDGEIKTACQEVCPAEAITFGDINDKTSAVSRAKADERNYELLGELGTKPRTTYLAGLRNPNPAIAGAGKPSKGHGGHG